MSSFGRADDRYHQRSYDDYDAPRNSRLSETYGSYEYNELRQGREEERWEDSRASIEDAREDMVDNEDSGERRNWDSNPDMDETSTYEDQRREDNYEEEQGEYADEIDDIYSPPIGYWHGSADFHTNAFAMKRLRENVGNVFDLNAGIHYKLAEGHAAEWSIDKEWGGEDGESAPYEYAGSKATPNRILNKIWLMEASNTGNTSQSLSFSLKNKHGQEMLSPMIPVLVSTKSAGAVWVSLHPKEKMTTPIALWLRNKRRTISYVVQANPGMTAKKLRSQVPADNVDTGMKNLIPGKSILLEFIQDKIKSEPRTHDNPLEAVGDAGFFRIMNEDVNAYISEWMKEQSRDLYVKHLNDLVIIPEKSSRSAVGSSGRDDDPFHDTAEIMGKASNWTLPDTKEAIKFAHNEIEFRTQSIYLKLRVEMLPVSDQRNGM